MYSTLQKKKHLNVAGIVNIKYIFIHCIQFLKTFFFHHQFIMIREEQKINETTIKSTLYKHLQSAPI